MDTDREKAIRFHLESKDYFASLATTLSLIQEASKSELLAINRSLKEVNHSMNALKRICDDLIFLQQEYKIEKKSTPTV